MRIIQCIKCEMLKYEDEFYACDLSRRYYACIKCVRAYASPKAKEYRRIRVSNPELRKEQTEYNAKYDLERKYGISWEEYHKLLDSQKGVCAICKTAPENNGTRKRRLTVDHDHSTGKIRKLLCDRCNLMLGHVNDNSALLRAMADYLDECSRTEHDIEKIEDRHKSDSEIKKSWTGFGSLSVGTLAPQGEAG